MSDAGDALSFPPGEEYPRRRRAWPWLVTLLIVLALLAGALVGAEWLARGAVEGTIRSLVVSQLGLGGSDVDVEVDGLILPQLLGGTLDDVTVSSSDVSFGQVSGDATVTITDLPVRADAAAGPGTAVVRLDEQQLRALLSTVEGFPADAAAIAAPDVTLSTELSVFGVGVPVGVALLPGAAEGDLTLTPRTFRVAEAEVDAGELSRFGALADPLTRTWDICIAQYLPAALGLTSVAVEGREVVASFAIDGAVVVDPALRQNGACA